MQRSKYRLCGPHIDSMIVCRRYFYIRVGRHHLRHRNRIDTDVITLLLSPRQTVPDESLSCRAICIDDRSILPSIHFLYNPRRQVINTDTQSSGCGSVIDLTLVVTGDHVSEYHSASKLLPSLFEINWTGILRRRPSCKDCRSFLQYQAAGLNAPLLSFQWALPRGKACRRRSKSSLIDIRKSRMTIPRSKLYRSKHSRRSSQTPRVLYDISYSLKKWSRFLW